MWFVGNGIFNVGTALQRGGRGGGGAMAAVHMSDHLLLREGFVTHVCSVQTKAVEM